MGFSYNPLWKLLIDNELTKEKFRTEVGLSPATIAKMGKGERVSLDVIGKICDYFNCSIESVVEYKPDIRE